MKNIKTRNLVNHINHMNNDNMRLVVEYRPGIYGGLYIDVPLAEEVAIEETYQMVENF